MASRKLLLKAARLLAHEARLMRESCELNGTQWACGSCDKKKGRCKAQRDHDAVARCAKQLREQA